MGKIEKSSFKSIYQTDKSRLKRQDVAPLSLLIASSDKRAF